MVLLKLSMPMPMLTHRLFAIIIVEEDQQTPLQPDSMQIAVATVAPRFAEVDIVVVAIAVAEFAAVIAEVADL